MVRNLLQRLLQRQAGFTLVELLVSTAIVGVVLATASALLVAGIRSSNPKSREQIQRVQLAMNQIGEDLSHGNWATNCAPGPCHRPTAFQNCDEMTSESFITLRVPQPMVQPSTSWGNGPVFLDGVTQLKVRYTIRPTYPGSPISLLTREVFQEEGSGQEQIFIREVLASNLASCDGTTQPLGGSFLSYNNGSSKTLEVVLRAKVEPTGGGGVAAASGQLVEVHGSWAIR